MDRVTHRTARSECEAMIRRKKNLHAGRHGGSGNTAAIGQSNSHCKPNLTRPGWQGDRLPSNWRERLPDP